MDTLAREITLTWIYLPPLKMVVTPEGTDSFLQKLPPFSIGFKYSGYNFLFTVVSLCKMAAKSSCMVSF